MSEKKGSAHFTGATRYVLDDELASIINISMALEMPLLLKGEPGGVVAGTPAGSTRSPRSNEAT